MQEFIINLDLPARKRWDFLVDYKEEINELLECYLNDFEGADHLFEGISEFKNDIIPQEYLNEIEFIASISKFNSNEVLIANLYYDVLKFYFGCTAFAIDNLKEPLHARNLDWWTDNNILGQYSRIFNFQRNNKTVFKTVGWFGFVGALSGIKPGHFSVTLNAVLSEDSPEIAMPISFFLREVLDKSTSYDNALESLKNTKIASDCLLLLTGSKSGQKAVIERTPTRNAVRTSDEAFISVTNDYKLLENIGANQNELQATSCGRYDRAIELIKLKQPAQMSECLEILQDDKVMMGITVQQMVFNVTTGEIALEKRVVT